MNAAQKELIRHFALLGYTGKELAEKVEDEGEWE